MFGSFFADKPSIEIAKTSGYQNNGGLNALVHVMISNMAIIDSLADVPGRDTSAAKAELLRCYQAEHGVHYASWNDLKTDLESISNPVQRELVLGPVLRRMATRGGKNVINHGTWEPLDKDDIQVIANRFGIKVEAFTTDDETERLAKLHFEPNIRATIEGEVRAQFGIGPGIALSGPSKNISELRIANAVREAVGEVLKLHKANKKLPNNPGYNIFNLPVPPAAIVDQAAFTTGTLKLFNDASLAPNQWGFVTSESAEVHNEAFEKIQKPYVYENDHAAVSAQLQDAKINKKQAAELLEQFEAKNGNAIPVEGNIQSSIKQSIGALGKAFSFGDKNSLFSKLFEMIGGILAAIFGMVPMFKKLNEQMNPKDPAKEDLEPEYIQAEAQKDPGLGLATANFESLSKKLSDKSVNKAWKAKPNDKEVWHDALDTLVEESGIEDAEAWLKKREKALLTELKTLGGKANTIAEEYSKAISVYHEPKEAEKNKVISAYTSEQVKTANLRSRLDLYLEASKMNQVVASKKSENEFHVKGVQKKAEQDSITKFAATPEGGNVLPGGVLPEPLALRFAKVQQEYAEIERNEQAFKATADVAQVNTAAGAVSIQMFTDFVAAISNVEKEAQHAKTAADAVAAKKEAEEFEIRKIAAGAGKGP